MASEACQHAERDEGVCRRCGHCLHEMILNGVCYFCGEVEPEVTVKQAKGPPIVPLSRLKQ